MEVYFGWQSCFSPSILNPPPRHPVSHASAAYTQLPKMERGPPERWDLQGNFWYTYLRLNFIGNYPFDITELLEMIVVASDHNDLPSVHSIQGYVTIITQPINCCSVVSSPTHLFWDLSRSRQELLLYIRSFCHWILPDLAQLDAEFLIVCLSCWSLGVCISC